MQLGIAKAQGRDKEFLQQLTTDQSAILSNVLDLVRHYQRYPGVVVPTFTPMPDAYRLETYWSGKAHQLGIDGVPVKYIARPCNSNGIYVPTKAVDFDERTSDFLQVELKRHIEQPLDLEEPACFDFYLQPLKTEAMTDPDGECPGRTTMAMGGRHDSGVERIGGASLPCGQDHADRPGADARDLRRSR